MEEGASEMDEVYEPWNLKPQLFINEVLNSGEDILDAAFDFFFQEASTLLKIDQSADLKKGVDYVRNKTQATLDKRLVTWEQYCLRHCFRVPEGFSLPSKNEPTCELVVDKDDPQLNEELELLRSKLAEVVSESTDLNQQLQKLEKQHALNSYRTHGSKEALQLYEQNSCRDMFEEMKKTAAVLKARMDKLMLKQVEDNEHNKRLGVDITNKDLSAPEFSKVLSDLDLAELEDFMIEMRT